MRQSFQKRAEMGISGPCIQPVQSLITQYAWTNFNRSRCHSKMCTDYHVPHSRNIMCWVWSVPKNTGWPQRQKQLNVADGPLEMRRVHCCYQKISSASWMKRLSMKERGDMPASTMLPALPEFDPWRRLSAVSLALGRKTKQRWIVKLCIAHRSGKKSSTLCTRTRERRGVLWFLEHCARNSPLWNSASNVPFSRWKSFRKIEEITAIRKY